VTFFDLSESKGPGKGGKVTYIFTSMVFIYIELFMRSWAILFRGLPNSTQ
jgi:hypothetical protein